MSKMKSDRRPPLPKSPIRLRHRCVYKSTTVSTSIQTPPGSLAKSQKPNRSWAMKDQELRSLWNDVRAEHGKRESENGGVSNSTSLFERGRFYEEYAALRNEWLERKKGQWAEGKSGYNLGVTVESVKRISSKKSVSAPRSLPSMSKENKKPPLPLKWNKASPGEETKLAARRVRRI